MRVRQFYQSCFFTTGLLNAALAVVCSSCNVSHGQSASSDRTSSVIQLVEAANFIDLPSTVLDEESSPSDSQETKAKGEDKATDQREFKAEEALKTDDKNANSSTNPGDGLTPMQNRELTIRVQAVSIAHEKIGTGLVPMSGSPRSTEQVLLPTGISRGMQYTVVCWRASNIRHFPLYFEDAMLERHGHTRCFLGYEVAQSFVSGAKFFGTIPLLPYLGTLRPKHDCVYALGHYRPGSCAPCLRDNIPYDAKAAIVESASAAAFFWAVPL
jgi:hypothetical protein